MNQELIIALEEWTLKNGRRVKIDMNSLNFNIEPKITIFAYDFKYMVGKTIRTIDDIPAESELKAIKKRELRAKLSELESLE